MRLPGLAIDVRDGCTDCVLCVDEGADVLGNPFARIERRTEIW